MYLMGKLNLLLTYCSILQMAALSLLGLLCILESRYLILFLAISFLSLIITSFLLFISGFLYLFLHCINRIIAYLSSSDFKLTKIEYSNPHLHILRVKWMSLSTLAALFILLYIYTYQTQIFPIHFIQGNREYILFGLTCLWLLASTGLLAYHRLKSYIKWSTQESVTTEVIKQKARSEHRDSIIGQCLYFPFFLFFMYVLTQIS